MAGRTEVIAARGDAAGVAEQARGQAGRLHSPGRRPIHVVGRQPDPRPPDASLPTPLPRLPLEPDWSDRPRLWGHSYHPMCSYLASFPAALAHAFVARYTRPGDVVLDPFSGRGTTPLQACAEGRIGVGNDLSPLAYVLTGAKVEAPSDRRIETRLARLRIEWSFEESAWVDLSSSVARGEPRLIPAAGSLADPAGGTEDVAAEVALAFHPRTLGQLLFIRSRLRIDEPVDRFLAAALVGILHGKRPGYLSEVMPNTFSMPPGYVRDFAARNAFASPERDVFLLVGAKLRRLGRDGRPPGRGLALLGDARDAGLRSRAALRGAGHPERARLVLASPPYLRVIRYGAYNWLRAWFLGFDPGQIDATLDHAHRRTPYAAFLREVLAGLRPVLADDAVIALVLGDVEADHGRAMAGGRAIRLAEEAWDLAARPEGYVLAGIARDEIAAQRKMTKLWGPEAGRATNVDRILVLATTEAGRRRAISGASLPIDWRWPHRR